MNKHEVRILVTQGVLGEVCLVFKTKKKKFTWTIKLEKVGFSSVCCVDKLCMLSRQQKLKKLCQAVLFSFIDNLCTVQQVIAIHTWTHKGVSHRSNMTLMQMSLVHHNIISCAA
jgi:hypothetical protein